MDKGKRTAAAIMILLAIWQANLIQAWAQDDNPIENIATEEIRLLAEHNPELMRADNYEKHKKIDEAIKEEADKIGYRLGVIPKGDADQTKAEEVEILKLAQKQARGGFLTPPRSPEFTMVKFLHAKNARTRQAASDAREVLKARGIYESIYDQASGQETAINTGLKSGSSFTPASVPFEAALDRNYQNGEIIKDIDQAEGATEPANYQINTMEGEKYYQDNTPQTQEYVQFIPQSARRVQGAIADNKVLYREAFDGIDVMKSIEPAGIKEDLIIKNGNTGHLDFRIKTKGLVMRIDPEGDLEFLDVNGQIKFHSPHPVMIDRLGNAKELKYKLVDEALVSALGLDQKTAEEIESEITQKGADSLRANTEKDPAISEPEKSEASGSAAEPQTGIEDPDLEADDQSEDQNSSSTASGVETASSSMASDKEPEAGAGSAEDLPAPAEESSRPAESVDSDPKAEVLSEADADNVVKNTENDTTSEAGPDGQAARDVGLAEKERSYRVVIELDYSGMAFPIDLDPTTYINLQDRGQVTFYGDYAQGTPYGTQGRMNSYGNITRGSESFLPQGNLVGYWPMDESSWNGTASEVKDYSGKGYNGTSYSGANTFLGKFANAGLFDGTNDYVSIADNTDLDSGAQLSISAWIYPRSAGESSYGRIISKYAGVADGWEFFLGNGNGNKLGIKINNNNLFSESGALSFNTWYHVAVTYKAGTGASFYINGSLAGTDSSYSTAIAANTSAVNIGRWPYSAERLFNGMIDEVAVWNRILAPAEIAHIANNGRVEDTDSRVTYVDPDGTRIPGAAGTSGTALRTNSVWGVSDNSAFSNGKFTRIYPPSGTPNSINDPFFENSYVEYSFVGTEIWLGAHRGNQRPTYKAVIDPGSANESTNFVNPHSDTVIAYGDKELIATGLTFATHTVRIYPTLIKNYNSQYIAGNSIFNFDYFEYYTPGYELASKTPITINDRATYGLNFATSVPATYSAVGNMQSNTSGAAERGTWSGWIKTNFAWNSDNIPHVVYSNEQQRLYYQYWQDEFDVSSTTAPKSITFYGGASTTPDQTKYGGGSYGFNGSSYQSTPDSEDWNFGSSDFTIDFWISYKSITDDFIISQWTNSSTDASNCAWGVRLQSGTLYFLYNATWVGVSWAPSLNTWYHATVVRSGTNIKFFINGNQQGVDQSIGSAALYSSSRQLDIGGSSYSSNYYLNGYLDEIRISKGIARWTSNFTPPAQKYQKSDIDSYTKLLLHGDSAGYFIMDQYDGSAWAQKRARSAEYNSSNTFATGTTIQLATSWDYASGLNLFVNNSKTAYAGSWNPQSVSGNMKIGGDEKVKLLLHGDVSSTTGAYFDSSGNGSQLTFYGNTQATTTINKLGGSAYVLDGTGDYMTVTDGADNDFGTKDFTIDLWIYPKADTHATQGIISTEESQGSTDYYGYNLHRTSSGAITFYGGSNQASAYNIALTKAAITSLNTWYHIAVVRSGINFKLFVNGIEQYSGTTAGAVDSYGTQPLTIGRYYGNYDSFYFNGVIDEVRIVKGRAEWTSNFTPPTAPYQSNLSVAEPAIFNYVLSDTEISTVYGSTISMGDLLSQFSFLGEGGEKNSLMAPIRIEETNQISRSLLFNYPGVQTPDARVGSFGGSLYKTAAPTGPNQSVNMNNVSWVGNWSLCATSNCKYTSDPNAYVSYTTATSATEIWATYNSYPDYGIAEYIIDEGTAQEIRTKIDQYKSGSAEDRYALIATGLQNTIHTIKARMLNQKNPAANYNRIIVGLGATANKIFVHGQTPDIATQNMVINGRVVKNVLTVDYATMPNAIQYADKGNISESAHEGTLSMWVQSAWAGNDSVLHELFNSADSAQKNGLYVFKHSDNRMYINYSDGTAGINLAYSNALTANDWKANVPHHVVAKWWKQTSATLSAALYLDGVKIAQYNGYTYTPTSHSTFLIGNINGGTETNDADAAIYDLSLWSWAFSDGGAAVGAMVDPNSDVGKSYRELSAQKKYDLSAQADGSETIFQLTDSLFLPAMPTNSTWIYSEARQPMAAFGMNMAYDAANERWYTVSGEYIYYTMGKDPRNPVWRYRDLALAGTHGFKKIYYDSVNSKWYILSDYTGSGVDSYVIVSDGADPLTASWTAKSVYASAATDSGYDLAYDTTNSRWYLVGMYNNGTPYAFLTYSSGSDLSTATWTFTWVSTASSNQQAYGVYWNATSSTCYVMGYYSGGSNLAYLWRSTNPTGGVSAWTGITVESGGTSYPAGMVYDATNDRYIMAGTSYSSSYDASVWYSSDANVASTTWTRQNIDLGSEHAYTWSIVKDPNSAAYYIANYHSGGVGGFWPVYVANQGDTDPENAIRIKSDNASLSVSSAKAGGMAVLENDYGGDLNATGTAVVIDPGETSTTTTLLLHADGWSGQKQSNDDSQYQHLLTHYGDAKISSAQSKFGGSSYYFDGTGDYIASVSDSYLSLTGDFTIDAWVRVSSAATHKAIASDGSTSEFWVSNGNKLAIYTTSCGGNLYGTLDVPADTWTHVAMVRSGTSLRTYVGGTQDLSITCAQTLIFNTIGAWNSTTHLFTGYLDELRLSQGIARWTSGFTPSSTPYLNTSYSMESNIDTGGGYLTIGWPGSMRSGEIAEYSSYDPASNTFTISRRGVQGTVPTAWPNNTPVKVGGTVSLSSAPASGSKLVASYNHAGDDLERDRAEMDAKMYRVNWLDITGAASTGWASTSAVNRSGLNQMTTQVAGQTAIGYFYGTFMDSIFSGDPTNGGVAAYVIDEGTAYERRVRSDQNTTITNQAYAQIAGGLSDGYHTFRFIGGIDETNAGSNKYSTFDAYISGVKADLGQSDANAGDDETLDSNYVNKVFYWPAWNDLDNASSTYDPQTVLLLHADGVNGATADTDYSLTRKTLTFYANAKISTASSTFGGASYYLDGTGDYMTTPYTSDFDFGTGDFTIDSWIFVGGAFGGSYGMIFYTGGVNTDQGILLALNSSYNLHYQSNGCLVTAGPALNDSKWHHVAVSRNGTTMRIFVDGNIIASNTSCTNAINRLNGPAIGATVNDASWGNALFFNGYIDELRISKGIARWTANFVPPTRPYSGFGLQSSISSNGTSLTVETPNPADFNKFGVPSGLLKIGSETIKYDSFILAATSAIAINLTRGYSGTTAASHSANDIIQPLGGWRNNGVTYNKSWRVQNGIFPEKALLVGTGRPGQVEGALSVINLADNSLWGRYSANSNGIGAAPVAISASAGKIFAGFGPGNGGMAIIDYITPSSSIPYVIESSTLLMLHADGTYGATVARDSALPAHVWTAGGNAIISNLQSKFGGGSFYFDGSGDYASANTGGDTNFNLGSTFTIDAWIYPTNLRDYAGIFSKVISDRSGTYTFMTVLMANGTLGAYSPATGWVASAATGIAINNWYHVTWVFDGGYVNYYVNGVSYGRSVISITDTAAHNTFIGSWYSSAATYDYAGYIDELRVTKGLARYQSSFTAPVTPPGGYVNDIVSNFDGTNYNVWAAFGNFGTSSMTGTNAGVSYMKDSRGDGLLDVQYNLAADIDIDSYTKLLIHADGAASSTSFTDAATAKAITNTGSVVQVANYTSKFSGSAWFNGTSGYLSAVDSNDWNLNNSDFTLELWYNANVSDTDYQYLIAQGDFNTTSYWGLRIQPNSTSQHILTFLWSNGAGTNNYVTSNNINHAAGNTGWVHATIIRTGDSFTFYINGQNYGTTVKSANNILPNDSNILDIGGAIWGGSMYGSYYYNGYIDELRISKGLARWSSNFTPPNTPYGNNFWATKIKYDSANKNIYAAETNGNVGLDRIMTISSPKQIASNSTLFDTNAYTKLLIHGEGASSSAAIYDSSVYSKSITAAGNAAISTQQSKFGGSSVWFDGNGDYLSLADSNDFDLSNYDFTIDTWIYYSSFSTAARNIIGQFDGGALRSWALYTQNNLLFFDYYDNYGNRYSPYISWTPSSGQWYHISVVRSLNNLYFFVDGVQTGSTQAIPYTIRNGDSALLVGAINAGGITNYMTGYLEEFRITKGLARWTSNFTPPAAAYDNGLTQFKATSLASVNDIAYDANNVYAALDNAINKYSKSDFTSVTSFTNASFASLPAGNDSYTKLLLHADGYPGQVYDRDYSASKNELAFTGDAKIATTTKFGNGAYYFDGAGDYISVPDSEDWNFSGDFTMDMWINFKTFNSADGFDTILWQGDGGGTNSSVQFDYYNTARQLRLITYGGAGSNTSFNVMFNLNTWNHIAVSRSGSVCYLFANGAMLGTSTCSNTITNSPNSLFFGLRPAVGDRYFNGYMDEIRISKGIARWTSNFTPPTIPYHYPALSIDYDANIGRLITGYKGMVVTSNTSGAQINYYNYSLAETAIGVSNTMGGQYFSSINWLPFYSGSGSSLSSGFVVGSDSGITISNFNSLTESVGNSYTPRSPGATVGTGFMIF